MIRAIATMRTIVRIKRLNCGVTLIEIIIVLFILTIVAALSVSSFIGYGKREKLDKAAEIVVATLAEARTLTLASKGGNVYGVHFDADAVVLFRGVTYDPNDPTNSKILLDKSVKISAFSLSGGSAEAVYNRLTGKTQNNGTVTLIVSDDPSMSRTITIYATGVAETN